MGDFSEHVLFGMLSASVAFYLVSDFVNLTGAETVMAGTMLFIGSVLPDIDHKNSYVHRAAKATLSISTGIFLALLAPFGIKDRFLLGIAGFTAVYIGFSLLKMKHRGFTHSVLFAFTVTMLVAAFGLYSASTLAPAVAVLLGISSHLILDGEFKFR